MTEDQLVRKVLGNLSIIELNETPAEEDAQIVLDNYPRVWNMLNTEGLTTWALGEDIPDNMALPFSKVLAGEIADEFTVPYNRGREGMFQLRRQVAQRRPYQPVTFQDY